MPKDKWFHFHACTGVGLKSTMKEVVLDSPPWAVRVGKILPLPTSNSDLGIGDFAKFADTSSQGQIRGFFGGFFPPIFWKEKGPKNSTKNLPKIHPGLCSENSPDFCRNFSWQIQADCSGAGIFSHCQLRILGHLSGNNSGKTKEPKPKLFGPDIFGWGGVFCMNGEGVVKKLGMYFETRETKLFFLAGYPGILAGISRACLKRLSKKGWLFSID